MKFSNLSIVECKRAQIGNNSGWEEDITDYVIVSVCEIFYLIGPTSFFASQAVN